MILCLSSRACWWPLTLYHVGCTSSERVSGITEDPRTLTGHRSAMQSRVVRAINYSTSQLHINSTLERAQFHNPTMETTVQHQDHHSHATCCPSQTTCTLIVPITYQCRTSELSYLTTRIIAYKTSLFGEVDPYLFEYVIMQTKLRNVLCLDVDR